MSSSFHSLTTLILLFVLQLGIALGTIAFYTLGFSYIDDNVYEHESPALISAGLAAKYWGVQFGSLVSLIIGWTPFGWFLGWVILAPILFIIGFIAVMFPRKLLSTLVRQAANNILETSTNANHASLSNSKFIADIGFFPSLARVFTNKIIILNVFAAVFVQTAIINFFRHESNYLQSRFFLPTSESDGLNNEWTSQLVVSLLKPPMLALAILTSGLIIAKAGPSSK
jgi:Organic Anion Transporter Polypeptide (OATP) family